MSEYRIYYVYIQSGAFFRPAGLHFVMELVFAADLHGCLVLIPFHSDFIILVFILISCVLGPILTSCFGCFFKQKNGVQIFRNKL